MISSCFVKIRAANCNLDKFSQIVGEMMSKLYRAYREYLKILNFSNKLINTMIDIS